MTEFKFIRLTVVAFIFAISAVAFGASNRAPDETQILWNYRKAHAAEIFNSQVAKLGREDRVALETTIRGLYFIDYVHAAGDLLKIYEGKVSLRQTRFYDRYNEPGNPAFEKLEEGIRYLAQLKSPLTTDSVADIHRATLVNYEDNQGPIEPGTYRTRFVYGPEFDQGLSNEKIAVIEANPYLFFMKGTGIWGDTPNGVDQAEIPGGLRGAIAYPRDRDIRQATLERIHQLSPEVYDRVLAYKAKNGDNYWNLDPQLTQDLTRALLNERLQTFAVERRQLGKIRTPLQLNRYIDLIVRLQRDFISVHPFNDGNGRTSRLILNHLCEIEGLPIPRITYPNEDIYSTPEIWTKKIRAGMLATLRLQADLSRRIRDHQKLSESLYLLTPVPLFGALGNRAQEEKFAKTLRRRLELDTDLEARFAIDPEGTLSSLSNEAEVNFPTRAADIN